MHSILLGCAAVAMFFGGAVLAPLHTSTTTSTVCPAGQVTNTEVPGFACETQCPPGMLLDAVTDSCIAATFDPPPLGMSATTQTQTTPTQTTPNGSASSFAPA